MKTLFHYKGEGMDEMDFTEAESVINDVWTEYDAAERPWGATVDDDYDENEECAQV